MKKRIYEIIEDEQNLIEEIENEIKSIKKKWVKFSVDFKLIQFLKYQLLLKNEGLNKLIKMKDELFKIGE